ncbi:hypothetical protein OH492_15055 [Vibrio chagasii]|nr:hypothetical protein [Vibrio chagasii]
MTADDGTITGLSPAKVQLRCFTTTSRCWQITALIEQDLKTWQGVAKVARNTQRDEVM